MSASIRVAIGMCAALASLTAGVAGAAVGPDLFEEAFGPADCTAFTGNGRLTVSVNQFGRITACRWPSPGYCDQVAYRTRERGLPALGVEPADGVMWGVRIDGKMHWLAGPPWQVGQSYRDGGSVAIESTAALSGGSTTFTQILFVHPERDLLVARLVIESEAEPSEVYWYANFSPCMRMIPEVPVADWALDGRNDFAVFADETGRGVCHFRPEAPGLYEWAYARELARVKAKPTAWAGFDEGVWIAARSAGPVAGIHCGRDFGEKSVLAQAEAGWMAGATSAVGQCASVTIARPRPLRDGAYEVTQFIAFGRTKAAGDEILAYAAERGYDALLAETQAYWGAWLDKCRLPDTWNTDLRARSGRCLLTIALAMDADTGGIIRSPVAQPPRALDWPRHGAWVSYALDTAGRHDLAARHADFYAGALRTKAGTGRPLGSLPAACYTDGTEAIPHLVMDAEAPAWMLWSLAEHAARIDEGEQRTACLEGLWPAVDLAGTFLAGWADARTGAPLYSFDAEALRDVRDDPLLLATYRGIRSALELAQSSGHERPEWRVRLDELEPLIRFRAFDSDGAWKCRHPLEVWFAGLIPEGDPRASQALDAEAGQLDALHGIEAARSLCLMGLYIAQHPEELPRVDVVFRRTLRRVMPDDRRAFAAGAPARVPDTLHAALCLVAASALCDATAP
ncbi:MAG: hypothetical protein JXR94_13745 [Candidatus Hydrogenedentes bacterium]|nr:hypothetical protein [Candidatus Hydrogenedentota bacterium]